MKPTRPAALGDTEFDGEKTWLCMGGSEWVDHLPVEEPPKVVWPNL